jgi:large subunit ribosomal protein L18
MKINHNKSAKAKRTMRVRAKVRGTTERPRLTVFRSNKATYLQVINDQKGVTIAFAQSVSTKDVTKIDETKAAAAVLAEKLKKAKITKLVFDRGSYRYHGRVKAVADAMREHGFEV